jgi:hypothetical protein
MVSMMGGMLLTSIASGQLISRTGRTLFRLIGGSVGTAVLGAIFADRRDGELARLVPGAAGTPASGTAITTQILAALEPAVRVAYAQAFALSLSTVFSVATAVAFVGFFSRRSCPSVRSARR